MKDAEFTKLVVRKTSKGSMIQKKGVLLLEHINKKGKMRESRIEEQMSSSLAQRLVPPRREKWMV
jgi:hypothetical protein